MKRTQFFFILCVVIALLTPSCEPEGESFDETLLIGKWQSGTLYYKYLADYTGATWDTADNVNENEAQAFTWTLMKSELTQNHILEMGGTVPKVYTVTELTSSSLKYHDDFGVSYSFTKVNN